MRYPWIEDDYISPSSTIEYVPEPLSDSFNLLLKLAGPSFRWSHECFIPF